MYDFPLRPFCCCSAKLFRGSQNSPVRKKKNTVAYIRYMIIISKSKFLFLEKFILSRNHNLYVQSTVSHFPKQFSIKIEYYF